MNDVARIQAVMPCARGCSRPPESEDQEPILLGARHGAFCDRCYWRTEHALKLAAPIVEHILTLVGGLRTPQTDGSQRAKKTAPLPFNSEAFNDANEIYSRLVYFCALFASRLNRQPPAPAARAWRTEGNRIVGLPNDTAPTSARYAVSVMANWLSIHLEDICALPATDDVSYFHDELTDIFRTNAKWPREEQPQRADVGCSDDDCDGRLIIYPPRDFEDERRIICEGCGTHLEPAEYEHQILVQNEMKAKRAQESATVQAHKRTAAHLLRKYGNAT